MAFYSNYLRQAKRVLKDFPNHNILLFGRPGAGKGSLAEVLTEEAGFVHIGVGPLIRRHMKGKTALATRFEKELGDHLILPDELASSMIIPELTAVQEDNKLFVLESYPVTLGQFNDFTTFIDEQKVKLVVLHLGVPEEDATRRLLLRKTCPLCHAPYPPGVEQCDACEVPLETRYDDERKIIAQRQLLYDEKTEPLLSKLHEHFPVEKIFG